MKNKKRALRRHHQKRIYKKRREERAAFWWGDIKNRSDRDYWLDQLHWLKHTGSLCSCYWCQGDKYRDLRHRHKLDLDKITKEY